MGVDAIQIAGNLAAARVIQAALQALDDCGRLAYREAPVVDAPRFNRVTRLPDPADCALVQQDDLLRRRQRLARLAVGIDRPAHGWHDRPPAHGAWHGSATPARPAFLNQDV
jgi:hypothetical protein